jgi:hypothetical protein
LRFADTLMLGPEASLPIDNIPLALNDAMSWVNNPTMVRRGFRFSI